jgi:hypothetical protein
MAEPPESNASGYRDYGVYKDEVIGTVQLSATGLKWESEPEAALRQLGAPSEVVSQMEALEPRQKQTVSLLLERASQLQPSGVQVQFEQRVYEERDEKADRIVTVRYEPILTTSNEPTRELFYLRVTFD